ncbi:tail fiber domain-containing protein [Phyllobacterium sp. SB3]|uniref:tail fiber domain-containing protein n=1 Tax=Phyllobacterium sp. SB3 TaxID=3156073 RepID=UPI0032AEF668
MANSSAQNKTSAQNYSTGNPAWATPGTTQYNNMNQQLQTAPMNVAAQTFQNGGMTPGSQTAANSMLQMGQSGNPYAQQGINTINSTVPTMQNIANNAQNIGPIDTSALQQNFGQVGTQSFDNLYNNATNIGPIDKSAMEQDFGQVGADNWQNIYNTAGQPGANQQYLTDYANGSMLQNNPYLDKMVQDAQNSVFDDTSRMFAAGGRYGSGMNQGVLADSLAKTSNDLRYNDYNQQVQNQLNASNAISGEQSNRLGIQGNAASGVAGIESTNIGNAMNQANALTGYKAQDVQNSLSGMGLALNAANSKANAEGTNIGNSINVANNLTGYRAQDVSNKLSGMNTALNAAGGIANAGANTASIGSNDFRDKLAALSGGAGLENQGFSNTLGMISALPTIQGNKTYDADKQMGIGNQIGQMSQGQLDDLINQFSQYDMQDWSRLGGLLSAGTQSAGNYGTQTSTSTQPMNILGALGTLFSGLPSGSDERLKKNAKKVGKTPAGHNVYEYEMKDEAPKGRVGILGVMAQEVEKKQPEAVGKFKHKGKTYKSVDYSKLH